MAGFGVQCVQGSVGGAAVVHGTLVDGRRVEDGLVGVAASPQYAAGLDIDGIDPRADQGPDVGVVDPHVRHAVVLFRSCGGVAVLAEVQFGGHSRVASDVFAGEEPAASDVSAGHRSAGVALQSGGQAGRGASGPAGQAGVGGSGGKGADHPEGVGGADAFQRPDGGKLPAFVGGLRQLEQRAGLQYVEAPADFQVQGSPTSAADRDQGHRTGRQEPLVGGGAGEVVFRTEVLDQGVEIFGGRGAGGFQPVGKKIDRPGAVQLHLSQGMKRLMSVRVGQLVPQTRQRHRLDRPVVRLGPDACRCDSHCQDECEAPLHHAASDVLLRRSKSAQSAERGGFAALKRTGGQPAGSQSPLLGLYWSSECSVACLSKNSNLNRKSLTGCAIYESAKKSRRPSFPWKAARRRLWCRGVFCWLSVSGCGDAAGRPGRPGPAGSSSPARESAPGS